MHPLEFLDQAEVYLADSKRAGAIDNLIQVCRAQQLELEQLHASLLATNEYAAALDARTIGDILIGG